jgi:hypothetical protein
VGGRGFEFFDGGQAPRVVSPRLPGRQNRRVLARLDLVDGCLEPRYALLLCHQLVDAHELLQPLLCQSSRLGLQAHARVNVCVDLPELSLDSRHFCACALECAVALPRLLFPATGLRPVEEILIACRVEE